MDKQQFIYNVNDGGVLLTITLHKGQCDAE